MPGESVKDLVVRLSFDHGDTKQQISAIKTELRMLDSGFAASAAQAAGFSGGLNQTGSAADQLRQKLSAQQQLVEKYGQAIEEANERLKKSVETHQEQGQKIEELKSKQAELTAEKEKLAAAMEAEARANGENSAAYQEMAQRMEELNQALTETGDELRRTEDAYSRSDRAINRNAQSVMRLQTEQNNARAALAETEQALQREETRLRHNADAWEAAAKSAEDFAETARTAGDRQEKLGGELSKASAAILGLGTASATAAIQWESAFAGVRKTVNGTEEELQAINDALLSMEVPTDFSELAEIAANAGQLGIATGEAGEGIIRFTRTMADLAETTDLTADAAATAFAQYANITGMPQDNIANLGSVTVELGNNLATTESQIVAFAQAIGAAGSQAGMTDQQIFGISGGLASLGLEAQAGGTAFSKALIAMKVAVETGNDDLKSFASVAGMSAQEFKQAFSQDAAGTFIQFVQGLSTGSQSAIVMLDKMGITETRLRDMLLRASNASSLMTKSVDMANRAWTENTALSNEAAVRYQTTESRMKMTGKQAQKVAMDFGKAILPAVNQGLEGIQGIIDKFNGLSDAQRAGIVKWAAYAAAVGPAISILGKANNAIGTVASGFASLARAVAAGGGMSGFLSTLAGLLGPAGILAVAAGVGLAAYKLYDYASGAKAAREAQQELNKQAKEWLETQAQTMYDTGTADPLARFGLSKDAFAGSEREAQDWLSSLIATWTDGKKETNAILKEYTDGFKKGSDDTRAAIAAQGELLEKHGAMTPGAKAKMDADLKQLDSYDKEVEKLLKKRQNGLLTDDEKARLEEIVKARTEIRMKYEYSSDGYEQIITQMNAEIERLKAAGEGGGDTSGLMGDTMNALAEGRRAYMDALSASYDAEYANIQLIEDETARQAALNALNEEYNRQRAEGEDAYNAAVQEAGKTAWEQGGYEEQVGQIDQLLAMLGDMENLDMPTLQGFAEGLDEGKLASMLSLVEQLKASGMSDQQLLDMGIDVNDLNAKIQAIRDLTEGVEGLEGINTMFGQALPEEIQRIMIGLDMTQAAADWAEFAAGGSLTPITPTLGEITETIDLTGNVTDVDWPEGTTFTMDGSGNITKVTTAEGTTFTVDSGSGKITRVTTASGLTVDVGGNVTDVDWPEGTTFTMDGSGNITKATTAEGTTFTVDGSGKITSVDVVTGITLPTFSTTAGVRLNPLDQAAIDAWQQANANTTIVGPPAKVGVSLGAGWAGKLSEALDAGLLTVTGEDGKKIEVTPEVLKQITAQDVALLGEDGTIHIVLTPEVGSPEGVEESTEAMNTTPVTGTVLEPLGRSAQDAVDEVNNLSGALNEAQTSLDAMKGSGAGFDEMGRTLPELQGEVDALSGSLNETIRGLSDADLEAIGGQIANLMAALASGEGTPEQITEWQTQLASLLTFVDSIQPDQYTSTGTGVMEGIAQGMQAYGWGGDAGSVATAIQTAVNGALSINSPSKVMNPTGQGVSEGIGQGMKQYSFAGDASSVASSIAGSFGSLSSRGASIGANFTSGLRRGIQSGRSGVINAARKVAEDAARAARQALDIHSPSRVTEGFGEMFDLGFVQGIEKAMPRVSRAVEEALYVRPGRAAYGAVYNTTTDSRDMSVANAINVERMEVRDSRDIQDVSRELFALVRRDQRLVGGR